MIEQVLLFFVTALVALALENAVFARGLGLNRSALRLDSPLSGLQFGAALTWMATVAAVPVAFINLWVAEAAFSNARLIRAPLFLVSVVVVYIATYYAAKHLVKPIYPAVRRLLPVSAFNTALFGAFFVSATQNYSAVETVGYALGTGLGCTIAMMVIYYARRRLVICPVPRSFRGMPILLIYLGLLSLAIYGLLGHGLPS